MNPDLDTLVTSLYVTDRRFVDREPPLGSETSGSESRPETVRRRVDGPWQRSRRCYKSIPKPVSSATPKHICAPGFHTCLPGRATTNACVAASQRCNTSSNTCPELLRPGMTTCGWWTPHQSNAAAAALPNNALTWPDGPNTATAPLIPDTFGVCVSTSFLPHRVYQSLGRCPLQRQTNAIPAWGCWHKET